MTRTLVVSIALGSVLLAGCTSSGTDGNAVNGSPIITDTSTSDLPSTDTPTPTEPETTTTSATPSSSTSTATSPAPSPNDCRLDELTVRALTGSGAQQQEFAAITFTNKGTRTCNMFGFPGISLRLQGAALASPATHTPATPHTIKLKPGDQVEAAITDFSACQAPLSDTVRISLPNSTDYVDRPLVLRGCRIVVDPVVLSE